MYDRAPHINGCRVKEEEGQYQAGSLDRIHVGAYVERKQEFTWAPKYVDSATIRRLLDVTLWSIRVTF